MSSVVAWLIALFALLLLCIGKGFDYVVAGVFMLLAIFVKLNSVFSTLQDTLLFHHWAHKDAMGGVDELKQAYPVKKEEPFKGTLWYNVDDPRGISPENVLDGDIWIPPHRGRKYLLVKGEWVDVTTHGPQS